jgi:hypothetical protein
LEIISSRSKQNLEVKFSKKVIGCIIKLDLTDFVDVNILESIFFANSLCNLNEAV